MLIEDRVPQSITAVGDANELLRGPASEPKQVTY